MGFGKALGIGFGLFVGINFAWIIVVQLVVVGQLTVFDSFTDIGAIFIILFGGITLSPLIVIGQLIMGPFLSMMVQMMGEMMGGSFASPLPENFMMLMIFGALGYIVPSLVTVIVVGKTAGGKGKAIGAWSIIAGASTALVWLAITFFSASVDLGILEYVGEVLDFTGMLRMGEAFASFTTQIVLVSGIVNWGFWGTFAMLFSKSDLI